MTTDAELLRRYADEGSEAAFGELVRRHVNLVYSIALRQCGGDAHLAEDVAQRVFTDLARKARQLAGHAVLGGWLYRSAQFAASDVVRAERRRRVREQEASAMQEISSSDPAAGDADWQKLAPVLDQAIGELAVSDRDAVVLRFFEGRPFADIGATLRLTEDAARMRVERALEKLRAALVRRGITSTTAALGVALANQAAAATVPAGVAASVTGVALTGAAASGGIAVMAAFMSTTKLQVAATIAVFLATMGGLAVQQRTNSQLREEIEALRKQYPPVTQIMAENVRLAKMAADVAEQRKAASELAGLRRGADSMQVMLLDLAAREDRNKRVRVAREELAAPLVGPVFPAMELDTPPKPRFQFQPVPPSQLSRTGIEVDFLFEVTIDARGDVRNVVALRSEPKEFEPGFVQTVREWTYTPARKDGQAVNSRIEVPIRFTMGKPVGPPQPARRLEKRDWF